MVVTYVMVAVCVVGVLGAVASALSYDKPSGGIGSPMRIPRHSRRGAKRPSPSRQLQAVEAALTEDDAQSEPCTTVRSRGRWGRV